MEMTSMFTLRTPDNSFIDWLPFICCFFLSRILFHLLCVCIVDWNRIETDWAFWKHNHAFNAMHDLGSIVFRKVMISLQFWLLWINIDLFRKYWVNLRCFAVWAVKRKCFCEIFSLPLDFNREAFLIKEMSRYSSINFVQKPFVDINESPIEWFLFWSERTHHPGLFWKGFQVDTD